MKIHKYIIKHVKAETGEDKYFIYNVWFNFIKTPFIETEVHEGIVNKFNWKTYKWHYAYCSLEDAKRALDRYINEPYIMYREHTITRCANSLWIDYSTGQRPGNHDWYEYSVGGNLECCKKKIDKLIERKNNRKFKEYIEI